jgi:hypothetical protein
VGLSDALGKERNASRGGGGSCSICILVTRLDPDDLAAFETAMADRMLPGTAIARALKSEGYDIAGSAVQRHRRGGCKGL